MKYEEIVKKVTQLAKKKDVSAIKEHIAMQIDIEGEGEGAFYVEVADSKMAVEPYEYYDRDCKLKSGADALIALFGGKLNIDDALANGSVVVEGDSSKAATIINAPAKKAPARKTAAKKPATKKTEAAKPTAAKKPAAKKAEAAKPAAEKKPAAKKAEAAKPAAEKKPVAKKAEAVKPAAEKKPATKSTTKKTSTK